MDDTWIRLSKRDANTLIALLADAKDHAFVANMMVQLVPLRHDDDFYEDDCPSCGATIVTIHCCREDGHNEPEPIGHCDSCEEPIYDASIGPDCLCREIGDG